MRSIVPETSTPSTSMVNRNSRATGMRYVPALSSW